MAWRVLLRHHSPKKPKATTPEILLAIAYQIHEEAGAMRALFSAAAMAAVLFSGAAQGQPVTYTLTGMGTGVPGTSKCATYQITIDVVIDGKSVKGTFKQQGREERQFATTIDEKGAFKAKATVGDGNVMDVNGTISGDEGRILLDGYCKFEGKLTRKK
jgi:hypothetical protein